MTEKELRDGVVQLARLAGWSVMWIPKVPVKHAGQPVRWQTPIGGDGKGWLDLLMVRERVLAVDLKARERDRGWTVTREQQQWIDRWRIAGARAYIWDVQDWNDGTVERELTERARVHPVVYPDEPAADVSEVDPRQLTF